MNKRKIGSKYEETAADYLLHKGYDILERNYRNPLGEIDIIAKKDGYLVYAEVRFRSSGKFGDPLESVDYRKQKQICRVAAWHYAKISESGDMPCRFDVIAIYPDGSIRHIENAFEFRR